MDTWKRMGRNIGSHMPTIVLACVALGILFPHELAPLAPLVPFLFAFMTFQGSLGNTVKQVIETVRHPLPLFAILGVTLVAMPLVSFFLASIIFAGNANIITGILLEYCVPIGIVSFMWVGMFSGDTALALTAILVSTIASPLMIPLTLRLLMGESIDMDVTGMMSSMVFMIALPALGGIAVNELTRGWGRDVLSPALDPLCKILLIVIIASNSTEMSEYVLNMTWERFGVALFILLFATSGFGWGVLAARLLGQPTSVLITMGFDCGLRNISSGAVIATQFFPGEVVFPVMCGTIFQQLLASTFGRLVTRFAADRTTVELRSR